MNSNLLKPARLKKLSDTVILCIYKAGQTVLKCAYWFLTILLFISCQRTLTPEMSGNVATQSNSSPAITVTVEQFLPIDTTQHSLINRLPWLPKEHPLAEITGNKVAHFYVANALKTKWLEATGPNPIYYELINTLNQAPEHGLNTDDYPAEEINDALKQIYRSHAVNKPALIDLDIRLTEVFFMFTTHLQNGRITHPGYGRNIWIRETTQNNLTDVALLVQAKNALLLRNAIDSLQPKHEQYPKLKGALSHYRSLEKISMPLIQVTDKMKPEERHASIPLVRKKLYLMNGSSNEAGDSVTLVDSLYYDQALATAVKEFQEGNGLTADGIIGIETVRLLNQSFQEKADRIALNMERLRWLPTTYGDHYIVVNIPEYTLRIFEKEKQTLQMNVIVGASSSPTPVFHDTVEYLVFSPTWTVPPSVMKNEVLPRLKKKATYYNSTKFSFYKNGVLIDPSLEPWDSVTNIGQYRVVQKPGADNALGLVKFVMPNDMHIYLHDTPDHTLFAKNFRALSHGCIRLSDPALLALYLLREEKAWNTHTIRKAMYSFNPVKTQLIKQYPVHLQYHTVWVDDQGKVNFREDIYGHDQRQMAILKKMPSLPLLAAN